MSFVNVTDGAAALAACAFAEMGARATPAIAIASTPADLSTLAIHPPQKPSDPGHEIAARQFSIRMQYIRRISVSRSHLILAALLLAAAGLGAARLVRTERVVEESRVAGRPIQMPDEGFVSSQTCRACHPSQYQSWHRSYHRTMTQIATPEGVAASFDGVPVDAASGGPMMLEQRGRQLWAEFDDPDAADERGRTGVGPRRIKRQVVMTTGSHHQQIYWYATGNSRVLGQLPAIWLTADRRWIPRRAAVMRPPGGAHVSE